MTRRRVNAGAKATLLYCGYPQGNLTSWAGEAGEMEKASRRVKGAPGKHEEPQARIPGHKVSFRISLCDFRVYLCAFCRYLCIQD